MKTYSDLTLTARKLLMQDDIPGYQLEARLLVAHAAGKTLAELLRDSNLYTTEEVADRVRCDIQRRLDGEPVAYITGDWEFYGIPLHITKDVLIPRMDTEIIIDAVRDLLTGRKMDARVLDLCTGSGCIACAIAKELPATRLVAVDISPSALQVCRQNVAANRLHSRVLCMQADALASPPLGIGMFDVIVSNPPYIPSAEIETLDASVRNYEPIWALDGGEDGLKFYRGIIKHWKTVLRPGGLIFFEVGEGQSPAVQDMLLSAGFSETTTRKDSGGTERVVIGLFGEPEG